ncbi:hypothetical protein BHE74_00044661 [Ensete ventricosum]|nr:hypothetical protein BHE74_00044661 [Ensete ventricosum]RZS01554.1 hypothetical protein BHM03_00031435 [Ensete ventricosum]
MPEAKKKQWWRGWEQLATSEVEQMPRLAEEEEDIDWGEEAEEVVTSVWGTPNGGCGCSCYDPSYRQAMKAMISAIEEQGCDDGGSARGKSRDGGWAVLAAEEEDDISRGGATLEQQ